MASKQFSGASRASPSHGHNAKPNPLLSQLRTTSHGSGGPLDDQNSSGVAAGPPDHFNQGLSSDYSTAGYSSNRIAANSKATTTKSNNNNNGLAMSQTRTTTHTSNQHNSGGNVGASSVSATPTGVVPQQT